jgi:hypothetical protein
MSRRLTFAQCAAWAIVIGGHLLIILLLSQIRPRDIQIPEPDSQNRSILLLDLTPPATSLPAQKPSPDRSTITRAREYPSPDTSGDSTAIEAPLAIPPIDWYLEAERVASGAEWAEPNEPKCRASDHPGSLRPECREPKRPSDWEPEPARAGFEGLLPYVRLGKRCVIGLGFFGCGIGKLPEANGDLFDDMNDPDLLRSSVPDIDE